MASHPRKSKRVHVRHLCSYTQHPYVMIQHPKVKITHQLFGSNCDKKGLRVNFAQCSEPHFPAFFRRDKTAMLIFVPLADRLPGSKQYADGGWGWCASKHRTPPRFRLSETAWSLHLISLELIFENCEATGSIPWSHARSLITKGRQLRDFLCPIEGRWEGNARTWPFNKG